MYILIEIHLYTGQYFFLLVNDNPTGEEIVDWHTVCVVNVINEGKIEHYSLHL